MKRIGLIDIGSNTVRLVLFEYSKETGLREIQNIKTPARLAGYLTEDNFMEEEGINLLVDILQSFKLIAEKYDVADLHPVATAAVRNSTNMEEIIKRVKDELDIDVKVISGKEEAYYGFHAVTHTISTHDAVTIDIGGGSTELTFFEDKELIYSTSIPYGVVTLQEMFFEGRAHNDREAIREARRHIKEELGKVRWLSKRRVPILAIGGSARNVARIHQSMVNYPIAGVHGYSLQRDGLDDVMDILRSTDGDDLDDIDGLSRDRSDIILPSLLVFQILYDIVDAREFKFSRKGIREGLAMSLIAKDEPEAFNKYKIYEDAMDQLANDFKLNPETAAKRTEITERVYHELNRHDLLTISKHDKYLLKNAAKIFYLGDFIDRDATSQHTFYLLANSNINGIVHRDRVRLALIASFKNKTLLKFYAEDVGWFDDEDIKLLLDLGSILKFSNALNISHTNIVHDLYLDENKNGFELTVEYKGDPIAEEYQASRQKKHIEKILGEKLEIKFIEA